MLIQLNLLYASHEDAEEPKLLFPPAIVQGDVSYQKKNCRQQSGKGLRFEICRIVGGFLQEPQSCPVFCLIDWWTENELC